MDVSDAAAEGVYLSPGHVYALSQVLRRPIVVYHEHPGPIPGTGTSMEGIYLPLSWKPNEVYCCKDPLTILFTVPEGKPNAFSFPWAWCKEARRALASSCLPRSSPGLGCKWIRRSIGIHCLRSPYPPSQFRSCKDPPRAGRHIQLLPRSLRIRFSHWKKLCTPMTLMPYISFAQ